jgi:hypothetical protein
MAKVVQAVGPDSLVVAETLAACVANQRLRTEPRRIAGSLEALKAAHASLLEKGGERKKKRKKEEETWRERKQEDKKGGDCGDEDDMRIKGEETKKKQLGLGSREHSRASTNR